MKLYSSDMPKVESPFIREIINGAYVCVPKINPDYKWVFEDSIAVEKMDGTNISVEIKDKKIVLIKNRENIVDPWVKGAKRFTEGIANALEKEIIIPKKMADGRYFGELMGPILQGNPYRFEQHIFMPFSYVMEFNTYKFWPDTLVTLQGKTDEEIYQVVSNTFKGLWSLLKRRRFGTPPDVDENSVFGDQNLSSEGIIFYSRDLKRMAKLRRDMFDWYKGRRHEKLVG
jgi:hypothetical protein